MEELEGVEEEMCPPMDSVALRSVAGANETAELELKPWTLVGESLAAFCPRQEAIVAQLRSEFPGATGDSQFTDYWSELAPDDQDYYQQLKQRFLHFNQAYRLPLRCTQTGWTTHGGQPFEIYCE